MKTCSGWTYVLMRRRNMSSSNAPPSREWNRALVPDVGGLFDIASSCYLVIYLTIKFSASSGCWKKNNFEIIRRWVGNLALCEDIWCRQGHCMIQHVNEVWDIGCKACMVENLGYLVWTLWFVHTAHRSKNLQAQTAVGEKHVTMVLLCR